METAFLTVAETTRDAILLTDVRGHVTYLNPAARELFGYGTEEVLGRPVDALMPVGFEEAFGKAMRQQPPSAGARAIGRTQELTGRRKDGSVLPVEVSFSSCRSGDELFFVGILRSLEERRQAEILLREREEQAHLAQKMEAVGKLAGGVAHDFNNLMTVILGYAEILCADLPEGEPHRMMAGEIKEAAENATALTRQLLAFGRRQLLRPKALDVNRLLGSIDGTLRGLVGEKVILRLRLDPALGTVQADQGQIQQVLVNLASNARDAMPGGGVLTIETRNVMAEDSPEPGGRLEKAGPYVLVAVTDDGCGMAEEVQSHLFEPFFTTKEPNKGTGLGLATVYGIVRQSGGEIRVWSEPGKGSSFRVYLPRSDAAAAPSSPSDAPVAPGGGGETILFVEDSDLIRRLVKEALAREGYKVLAAASGPEALRLSGEHRGPIHLLLTDVVMPEMRGPQLAGHLAAARPGIKILYISGFTRGALSKDGILDPSTDLLEKPFTPQDLARRVRQMLDRATPARGQV